jgi:hypothetical protein
MALWKISNSLSGSIPKWKAAWIKRGWGWDKPGNWPDRTYTAIVLIDSAKAGETTFLINNTKGYLSGIAPSYPGASVVSEDTCPKGSASCGATIEIPGTKAKAFTYYKNKLISQGWVMDAALSASHERQTLGQKGLWGIINSNREKITLSVQFP